VRAGGAGGGERARAEESKRAREQESKRAREQESKRAREQESERASERERARARERERGSLYLSASAVSTSTLSMLSRTLAVWAFRNSLITLHEVNEFLASQAVNLPFSFSIR
jgi:uncharacterized membrane protein YdbT with pleckstrin-like domain